MESTYELTILSFHASRTGVEEQPLTTLKLNTSWQHRTNASIESQFFSSEDVPLKRCSKHLNILITLQSFYSIKT